jgi:hypothetical protein
LESGAPVAQRIERWSPEPKIARSNRARRILIPEGIFKVKNMKIAEFQRSRDKLKESILNIGRGIEENSEKILDEATINRERKKRKIKKGNPFYHDIEQSVVVTYNARLERAVGYFRYSVGDETTEAYLIYTPENDLAMAMNNGWNFTNEKIVIDSIARHKNMKVLE